VVVGAAGLAALLRASRPRAAQEAPVGLLELAAEAAATAPAAARNLGPGPRRIRPAGADLPVGNLVLR
jgi:hypothetical protein